MTDPATPTRPLIMMYHYVWADEQPIPGGVRPLMASEFERQLDWLAERYDIVEPDEFLARLDRPSHGRRQPCLLTFDDGTRDHAEVVTPILARRNVGGVFFVLTWPTKHKRMPFAHAIHWLLGLGDEAAWEAFERYAIDRLGNPSMLGDPTEAMRFYGYEPPIRARIKFAANVALPTHVTEEIVTSATDKAGRTSQDLAAEWFASADQVRQMHEAGMTIAMHGASHRSLQALGPDGIRSEIHECHDYLTDLLGQRPTWFACPFGGGGASSDATRAMQETLRTLSVKGAVTVEKAPVPPGCDPLRLPRLDAIDVPPRRATPAVPL